MTSYVKVTFHLTIPQREEMAVYIEKQHQLLRGTTTLQVLHRGLLRLHSALGGANDGTHTEDMGGRKKR